MSFYPRLYEGKKKTDSSIPGAEVMEAIPDIRKLPGLQNLSYEEVNALAFQGNENWGKGGAASILDAKELYDELSGELVGISNKPKIDPFKPIPQDLELHTAIKGPKRRLFELYKKEGKTFADLINVLKTWNKGIQQFFDELESETFHLDKDVNINILNNFFDEKIENGSVKFQEFLHSLPGGESQRYVNFLLDLMVKIVNTSGTKSVKGQITSKIELSTSQAKEWYDSMPKYLKQYYEITEINDIYHKEILRKDSFLNTLFLIKPEGVGRGEILFAYLFNNCKISGGGQPFDVYLGGKNDTHKPNKVAIKETKFELKDYVIENKKLDVKTIEDESIRLGTGGKVTRFEFWDIFVDTVKICKSLYKKYGKDLEKLVGPYMYKVWENIIGEGANNDKQVAPAIESGELSTEKIIVLKGFYALANSLKNNDDDDSYTVMKLRNRKTGERESFLVATGDYSKGDKIEILGEPGIIEVISDLSGIKYVLKPDQLERDLNQAAVDYFEHEGLDAFVVFRPAGINIARKNDFIYATISQAGVKFVEKEALITAKGNKLQDAAEKLMNRQIDAEVNAILKQPGNEKNKEEIRSDIEKNYNIDDFFLKVLKTGKASDRLNAKGVSNESYYPRLFKD